MLLSSILSTKRTLFSISCKADLVMMNSLSFCLRKSIFPSFTKDSFARCGILGWQVFFCVCVFVLISIYISHFILACKYFAEECTDSLMGVSLCVMSHFSFDAFQIILYSLPSNLNTKICSVFLFSIMVTCFLWVSFWH